MGYLPRDRALLLMGHGHFMIRLKEWLVWKPEETATKFEVLVTSGHDRVFGEMVRAQRAEAKKKEEDEYRKKRAAQKEASKEKAGAKDKEEGDAKLLVAIPVKLDQPLPDDKKHEQQVQLAAPGEAAAAGHKAEPQEKEQARPKEVQEAVDQADKVLKALPAGGGGAKMEDIKAAFDALEVATGGTSLHSSPA